MKFGETIQKHLIHFKEYCQYLPSSSQNKKWEYLEVTDNLYPPIRNGFMQYVSDEAITFHDYARHVRSSQIFCFNLFYPLLKSNSLQKFFSQKFNLNIQSITDWHFEYQPQKDLLGEWRGSQKPSDYITSVDLALFARTEFKKIAFLIEVKFSEESFSKCGGYLSSGNKNKNFCMDAFDFNFIEPNCYLIKNKSRQYHQLTKNIYLQYPIGFCPFADNNQCQRNHAFAKALISDGLVDEAFFGLVYHDHNNEIKSKWDNYKSFCSTIEQNYLFEMKASELVSISDDQTYKKYFNDRYKV